MTGEATENNPATEQVLPQAQAETRLGTEFDSDESVPELKEHTPQRQPYKPSWQQQVELMKNWSVKQNNWVFDGLLGLLESLCRNPKISSLLSQSQLSTRAQVQTPT